MLVYLTGGDMSSVTTGATDTGADDSMQGSDIVPKELKDLRMRLNYLKNIYDIKDTEVGSYFYI